MLKFEIKKKKALLILTSHVYNFLTSNYRVMGFHGLTNNTMNEDYFGPSPLIVRPLILNTNMFFSLNLFTWRIDIYTLTN